MTVSIWSLIATPFFMVGLLWLLEGPDRRIRREIEEERKKWVKDNAEKS